MMRSAKLLPTLCVLAFACSSNSSSPSNGGAGGAAMGGTNSGGTTASGGATSSGGTATGGAATGGTPTTGGSSSGGSAGTTATGGTSTGGTSTGGTSTGGTSTGGKGTGGTSTGGNSTGGKGTGGTSTGGSSTGGSSTGGSSTGGSSTGGSSTGGTTGSVPTIGGCPIFTANDAWNTDAYNATVDATWTTRVQNLVGAINLHPDFGGAGQYGIPINVVPQTQAMVPITFDAYPSESDPGPWPIPGPSTVKIEGGTATNCSGDCHLLVIEQGVCLLYEGYACAYKTDGWHCANGAKWDLTKNSAGQRPVGWTSADAAGLAITAGLLRYSEVAAGAVNHAIRYTLSCTTNKYVSPATHYAVPTNKPLCDPANPDPTMPPMGLRVRLKRTYNISGFNAHVQTILKAMQHYGMILADNGSNFYFQGDGDPAWPDADISQLKTVPASQFEAVGVGPLMP